MLLLKETLKFPAAPSASLATTGTPLHLKFIGQVRPLPSKIFGANADAGSEQLLNDPLKISGNCPNSSC